MSIRRSGEGVSSDKLAAVQLVVAEKPSVARDLARVLGVRGAGKHAIEGSKHVLTWCIGHLVELEEPAAYDARWKAWRLDTLPMLPAAFKLRPVPRRAISCGPCASCCATGASRRSSTPATRGARAS